MAENQLRTHPGPRPLPLHLATANLILLSSLAAWPSVRHGWPPLKPGTLPPENVAQLSAGLQAQPPEEFARALAREIAQRLQHFGAGISAYRSHPRPTAADPPPERFREGTARILDFGPADGPPVLMVPSLVNRHYVLDLGPGQSLARYLAGRGLHVMVVDWGEPGPQELDFDLTAYVQRLARWLRRLRRETGRQVSLLGYCMGGNLALAAALKAPQVVERLALLATPWDFHAGGEHQAALVRQLAPLLAPEPPVNPAVPPLPLAVDMLQAFFWALDPLTALKKFSHFRTLPEDSDAARRFVAMEDWLNDGIPLAGRVARECLQGWYGENTTATGTWRIDDRPVNPGLWRRPALVVMPERDRLVPKASAEALWRSLPGAARLDAPSGHIGMVVGPRAETGLWAPLADWLQQEAAAIGPKS